MTYLYGGSFDTEQISDRDQLAQLRKLVVEYKIEEFKAMIGDANIEEIDEDTNDGHSSEDHGEKVICGTQGLDILLDCLDKDNEKVAENVDADDDEWDEVCKHLTQSRNLASETESSGPLINTNIQSSSEEHETINKNDATDCE